MGTSQEEEAEVLLKAAPLAVVAEVTAMAGEKAKRPGVFYESMEEN